MSYLHSIEESINICNGTLGCPPVASGNFAFNRFVEAIIRYCWSEKADTYAQRPFSPMKNEKMWDFLMRVYEWSPSTEEIRKVRETYARSGCLVEISRKPGTGDRKISLNLSNAKLDKFGADLMVNVRHLISLNLSNAFIGGFSKNGSLVGQVAKTIKGSASLQNLDLSRNNLGGAAVETLRGAIVSRGSDKASLQTLSLSENPLGVKGLYAAGRLLHETQGSLRQLCLSSCSIDDEGAYAFTQGLRADCVAAAGSSLHPPSVPTATSTCTYPRACDLDLSTNHLRFKGLATLGVGLFSGTPDLVPVPVIRILRLRQNDHHGDTNTAGLFAFFNSITRAQHLLALDMSGWTVIGLHMHYFFDALLAAWANRQGEKEGKDSFVPPLKALCLNRLQIGYVGAEKVSAILQTRHPLRVLCMQRCCIGGRGRAAIRAALRLDDSLQFIQLGELNEDSESDGEEEVADGLVQDTHSEVSILRYVPWPLHLKVALISCNVLPQDALRLVFEMLKIPLIRRVQVAG